MNEKMSNERFNHEYNRLLHAIQTGAAQLAQYDTRITSGDSVYIHKHLRVGVDSTKCELGALIELLLEKEIIDIEDIKKKTLQYLQQDKEWYEKELSNTLGVPVNLG